jgi:hypothetical protein
LCCLFFLLPLFFPLGGKEVTDVDAVVLLLLLSLTTDLLLARLLFGDLGDVELLLLLLLLDQLLFPSMATGGRENIPAHDQREQGGERDDEDAEEEEEE